MDSSARTTSTERASTSGPTVESTKASGSTTRWRVRESSHGVTAEDMWVNIRTIKKTGSEPSNGPTAESTSDSGAKASNTARGNTSKKVRAAMASGKWVKELSGLRTKTKLRCEQLFEFTVYNFYRIHT